MPYMVSERAIASSASSGRFCFSGRTRQRKGKPTRRDRYRHGRSRSTGRALRENRRPFIQGCRCILFSEPTWATHVLCLILPLSPFPRGCGQVLPTTLAWVAQQEKRATARWVEGVIWKRGTGNAKAAATIVSVSASTTRTAFCASNYSKGALMVGRTHTLRST